MALASQDGLGCFHCSFILGAEFVCISCEIGKNSVYAMAKLHATAKQKPIHCYEACLQLFWINTNNSTFNSSRLYFNVISFFRLMMLKLTSSRYHHHLKQQVR